MDKIRARGRSRRGDWLQYCQLRFPVLARPRQGPQSDHFSISRPRERCVVKDSWNGVKSLKLTVAYDDSIAVYSGTRTEAKDTHFSSKAYGTRDSKNTELQGRLQLDILQVMQRDYKLRSYSLNSVSYEFLGA